jgi:hypothetical protein
MELRQFKCAEAGELPVLSSQEIFENKLFDWYDDYLSNPDEVPSKKELMEYGRFRNLLDCKVAIIYSSRHNILFLVKPNKDDLIISVVASTVIA